MIELLVPKYGFMIILTGKNLHHKEMEDFQLPSGRVPDMEDARLVIPLLPPQADAPLQLQLAVTFLF